MKTVSYTKNDIKNWIIHKLEQEFHIPSTEIGLNEEFTDHGLGSLQAATLSGELEDWLGKKISPLIFYEYNTVNKLSAFLANNPDPPVKKNQTSKHHHQPQQDLFLESNEVKQLQQYRHWIKQIAQQELFFDINEAIANHHTIIDNKSYLNFSSYNYLNLSGDARVTKKVIAAIKKYGTSVSGSRLIGGQKILHWQLENTLAKLLHTESALVFNSGHATNVTTIGHLMKKDDLILMDKLSHNSIVQGGLLSGAVVKFYNHNNSHSLHGLLKKYRDQYKKVLIITEGVFSMDGDIPPLPEYIELKNQFNAWLYVDEAHSLGVIGEKGAGIQEYFGLATNEIEILMGTLSKALGSCGGYIAGNQALINYLKFSAPGFVYSCGLTPADTAAALASLVIMMSEPERVHRLQYLSNFLLNLLKEENIDTGLSANTPIIPVIIGETEKTIALCAKLRKQGIYLQSLFYPAVEEGAARLRIFINCSHKEDDLIHLVKSIKKSL